MYKDRMEQSFNKLDRINKSTRLSPIRNLAVVEKERDEMRDKLHD